MKTLDAMRMRTWEKTDQNPLDSKDLHLPVQREMYIRREG